MSIYEDYEKRGLMDYKLRNVEDVKVLHGTDITKVKGLDELSNEDKEVVISLFINYLNGCGCGNRQDTPIRVNKLNDDKFKIYFKGKQCSYFFRDGSVG